MAKYVIELDDEPCMRENGYNFYTCKTVPWWSISDMIINRLTPYTEPDRKTIEDAQEEAWKMASKCLWDITNSQSRVIFGMDCVYVPRDLSYQEAKARYKAWKKQNDEIRVGDEVTFYIGPNDEMKAVALDQTGIEGEWSLFTENGCVEEHAEDFIRKTGRHFDDVEELLKKMNEK